MGSIREMPPIPMSAIERGYPKARRASMQSLWAASMPSTSKVGSASAKPAACASARASAKGSPSALIRREDIVARPVKDTEDVADPVPDEAVPYRPYHGYAAADGRLEAYLAAALRGRAEYLVALSRQEGPCSP